MTVDPAVIPGLLVLAAELIVLAAVGFVVVRVALRQTDDRMALAQGLVVGPALWGFIASFVLFAIPGRAAGIVAWGVMLLLGAALVLRTREPIWPRARTVAGIVTAALALFWVALASRQLMPIPDPELHLGLSASIQAGGFPPVLPWNPWLPAQYHHGVDLLVALLAPPAGPDLAFVTELLGAYVWMSFVLVVGVLVLKRGSWIVALAVVPLLLTAGAWTLVFDPPPDVLKAALPAGMPAADLPASVSEIYWPSPDAPKIHIRDAAPPNIWKPLFVLAYALTVIVLERAAAGGRRSWPRALALAALLGFLALADETVAVLVLGLWIGLEVWQFLRARRESSNHDRSLLRAAAGPLVAALFLAAGGSAITGVLTGASDTSLSLAWLEDPGSRRPLGDFTQQAGGLGVLGLGAIPIAAVALLAWRDRLVLVLAAGSGLFLLAALTLNYESAPHDVVRLDGYARNFALLALLAALGPRLQTLRPRWRYAAAALVVALVTWPTAVAPAQAMGAALRRGPQLSNAQPAPPGDLPWFLQRYVIDSAMSERVAVYIRTHTPVDARVLSPHPTAMSIATGRPNAAGFVHIRHLSLVLGPDYLDAIRYLEPAALEQLGSTYLHATDAWRAQLPSRASKLLENPALFHPLIRDGADALYRVQPAFLQSNASPHPASFQALQRAVSPSTTVYLSPTIDPYEEFRIASVLSHARLFGHVSLVGVHLPSNFDTAPLGEQTPDLVVTSAGLAPTTFRLGHRRPVWRNAEVAVYAPAGALAPLTHPPPPLVDVSVDPVQASDGRFTFTATFIDRAPERWTNQDWVVAATDPSPWALPRLTHNYQPWFDGQVHSGLGTTMLTYKFDAHAAELRVLGPDGRFAAVRRSDGELGPGRWALLARLLRQCSAGNCETVAVIPVIHIAISEAGEIAYEVYPGARRVQAPP